MTSKADRFKELVSSFVHSRNEEDNAKAVLPNVKTKEEISRQPRDKRAFYHRLHSFTQLTWFAKPAWLSPPICARYGWQNVDIDILQCVTCKAFLAGRMPSSFQPSIYTECCKKLKESLKTAHHPFCPWSNNPSPKAYLSVPVPNIKEMTQVLLQLISLGERLPKFTPECLSKLGIVPKALVRLQSSLDLTETCDLQVFASASVLALCGWHMRGKVAGLLGCSFCNREVGLWNYTQLNYNSDQEESEEEEESFPAKKSIMSSINGTEMETETAGKTELSNGTDNGTSNGIGHKMSKSVLNPVVSHDDSVVSSSLDADSMSDIFNKGHSHEVEQCVEDLLTSVATNQRPVSNSSDEDTQNEDRKGSTETVKIGIEGSIDNKDHKWKQEMKQEHAESEEVQENLIFKDEVSESQTTNRKGSRIAEIAASLKSKVEKTSEKSPVKSEENEQKDSIDTDKESEEGVNQSLKADSNIPEKSGRTDDKSGQVSEESIVSIEGPTYQGTDDSGRPAESETTEASSDLNESSEIARSDRYRQSNAEIPDESLIEVIDSSSEDDDSDQGPPDYNFGVEVEVGGAGDGIGVHGIAAGQHYFQNGYASEEGAGDHAGDSSNEEEVEIEGEDSDDVEEASSENSEEVIIEEAEEEEEESFEQGEQPEEVSFLEEESDEYEITSSQDNDDEDGVELPDVTKDVTSGASAGGVGNMDQRSGGEDSSEEQSETSEEVVGFSHLYEQGVGAVMPGMDFDNSEEGYEYESSEVSPEESEEAEVASDNSSDVVMILSSDSEEATATVQADGNTASQYIEYRQEEKKTSTNMATESFSNDLMSHSERQKEDGEYGVQLETGSELHLQLSSSPGEEDQSEEIHAETLQQWGEQSQVHIGGMMTENSDRRNKHEQFDIVGIVEEGHQVAINEGAVTEQHWVINDQEQIARDNKQELREADTLITESIQGSINDSVSEENVVHKLSGELNDTVEKEQCIAEAEILTRNVSQESIQKLSNIYSNDSVNTKDIISANCEIGLEIDNVTNKIDTDVTMETAQKRDVLSEAEEQDSSPSCTISQKNVDSMEVSSDMQGERMEDVTSSSGSSEVSTAQDVHNLQAAEKTNMSTDTAENSPSLSARKRKRKTSKVSFDALQEHRSWCVWVSSLSCTGELLGEEGGLCTADYTDRYNRGGGNGASEPAWMVMRDAFLPEVSPVKEDDVHRIKTSPPVEGLRRIRRLLSGWASPQVKVKGPHSSRPK